MEKLKLIVSAPMPFAGTDFTKYETLIKQAEENHHTMGIIQYLHGNVEHKMGYDIALCLNANICVDETGKNFNPGIYDTEVVDYPNPCRAYMWNANNKPRCLVVDIADEEAVEYAIECYEDKEYFI